MAAARVDWRKMAAAACLKVDWSQVAVAALGSAALAELVVDSLHRLGRKLEADALASLQVPRTTEASEPPAASTSNDASAPLECDDKSPPQSEDATEQLFVDAKVVRAAAVLGVEVDATADTIRAALRTRLSCSRLHPDHGGDGEEATVLIAAKNLLIERARAMRP